MEKKATYADRFPCTTYKWGQLTFVPHYAKHNVWVGPGYGSNHQTEWTAQALVAVGAKPVKGLLWSRPSSDRHERRAA